MSTEDNKTYSGTLKKSADTTSSVLSVGYDPAPLEFPLKDVSGYDPDLPNPVSEYDGEKTTNHIIKYFSDFLDECIDNSVNIGCFKFNLGYFRMYDETGNYYGSDALAEILSLVNDFADIPVILDVKDADIARSSAAYAISKLKIDTIDAITVHPYMGTDSVNPFFEFAHKRGKGVYVLTRTTNPGAADFQDLQIKYESNKNAKQNDSTRLYEEIAHKIVDWSRDYPGTVGSVAAGNDPAELQNIAQIYAQTNHDIPLLIPGVGTQGGEANEVMESLDKAGYDHRLARINSSSGVMYRAQKDGSDRSAPLASCDHVLKLNKEINLGGYV